MEKVLITGITGQDGIFLSKNILKTIDLGMINSVSIMVDNNKKIYETLNSRKVKKKLHINLTDFSPNHKFENNELILKKLTFLKLLFLKKKQREVVFNEIERQINLYVDYFKVSEIIVDGHQHIHVIPWIYNYLVKYENIRIVEIRLPKEKFFIGDIKTFFKLKFYRNIIAYLLLNIIITFFLKENFEKYDIVIGMYHDQVLTPIKTLFGFDAINITAGLPFIRVSPDHGPNEKMVLKGISNPLSLIKSINFFEEINDRKT